MRAATRYDPRPSYRCPGEVSSGWHALCGDLPTGDTVLAVDGPMVLDWDALIDAVSVVLEERGIAVDVVDIRAHMAAWEQILKRTAPVEALRDDPDFATIATGNLADLFDELPSAPRDGERLGLIVGPGAALVPHDQLWYADLPKRYAEAAVASGAGRNLGQPEGTGVSTTRRLFYVDWPLLDRHRDSLALRIDRWIDAQDLKQPNWIEGNALRNGLQILAQQPFRTRPTFNVTSWGGHWAQDELGFNPDARNTALGYELIAPESGILLGRRDGALVEVPFQLLVSIHPESVLGAAAHEKFGTSFPIRFDYLDTVGGGSLSVHCHPREDDMRKVFGWPYTQHETYYVMVGSNDGQVYLGLRDDADVEEFSRYAREADEHGVAFDIERFVQTFPAAQHQLFLIPAGTPHGSGAGNVVLEISATPYLYSLRFYDWLRRDADGVQRPVHVDHAFRNLDRARKGGAVRANLVQQPRILTSGIDWREDLLGALPDMFFEVRRLEIDPDTIAPQNTEDRFHVLNLVEGERVTIRTEGHEHDLAYAETIVVPAAVGRYDIVSPPSSSVRIVKALVR